MKRPAGEYEETYNLAARFLRVFQVLNNLTKQEVPDKLVDQLSINQLRALGIIDQNPGITQKILAEKLHITAASVSVSINKMVENTFIEKLPDPDDGRAMLLYLGPRGQKLVKQAQAQQTNMIADLLDNLSIEEQQLMVDALERALVAREQKLLV